MDHSEGGSSVASEVRALAQRSADAAKDVKAKITTSSKQVETGVALVGETGKSLDRINARIEEISRLVDSIAMSAQQQAGGLQEVNVAVGQMDGVTQQNAAMVEEATAAARSLLAEAEGLSAQVSKFELGENAAPASLIPINGNAEARRMRPKLAPGPRSHGNLMLAPQAEDEWAQF